MTDDEINHYAAITRRQAGLPVREPILPPADSPSVGSVWQHWKGAYYIVRGMAINEADLQPLVLYSPEDGNGPIWARPLADWGQRFRKE